MKLTQLNVLQTCLLYHDISAFCLFLSPNYGNFVRLREIIHAEGCTVSICESDACAAIKGWYLNFICESVGRNISLSCWLWLLQRKLPTYEPAPTDVPPAVRRRKLQVSIYVSFLSDMLISRSHVQNVSFTVLSGPVTRHYLTCSNRYTCTEGTWKHTLSLIESVKLRDA